MLRVRTMLLSSTTSAAPQTRVMSDARSRDAAARGVFVKGAPCVCGPTAHPHPAHTSRHEAISLGLVVLPLAHPREHRTPQPTCDPSANHRGCELTPRNDTSPTHHRWLSSHCSHPHPYHACDLHPHHREERGHTLQLTAGAVGLQEVRRGRVSRVMRRQLREWQHTGRVRPFTLCRHSCLSACAPLRPLCLHGSLAFHPLELPQCGCPARATRPSDVLYWTLSHIKHHAHTPPAAPACVHSHRSGAVDPFTAPLAPLVCAAAVRPVWRRESALYACSHPR